MTAARVLLIAFGILAFCLALDQPAAPGDAWHIGPRKGLECLIVGFVFWPSNALLLISPLVAFLLSRKSRPALFTVVAVVYLASDGLVLFGTAGQIPLAGILPGYLLWLCAHALVTAGVLMPTWSAKQS